MSAPSSRGKPLADLDEWPASWKATNRDLPLGREIVRALRPFLEDLLAGSLTDRTVRRHVDNAWLLGGEIVRHASYETDPELRELEGRELLLRFVDQEGGPLLSAAGPTEEQLQLDTTCRKLHRFLRRQADEA